MPPMEELTSRTGVCKHGRAVPWRVLVLDNFVRDSIGPDRVRRSGLAVSEGGFCEPVLFPQGQQRFRRPQAVGSPCGREVGSVSHADEEKTCGRLRVPELGRGPETM